jgi:hypothetical protein
MDPYYVPLLEKSYTLRRSQIFICVKKSKEQNKRGLILKIKIDAPLRACGWPQNFFFDKFSSDSAILSEV